ncbi:hypothetical protein GCM10009560_02260 [Nonomuraea longicatena]|uniref:Uncharacterized protein n=1 Tax=Nonomuraea longicatena TaxID=83682 RepID=A0ABN1NM81_9ACTN
MPKRANLVFCTHKGYPDKYRRYREKPDTGSGLTPGGVPGGTCYREGLGWGLMPGGPESPLARGLPQARWVTTPAVIVARQGGADSSAEYG